MVARERTSQSIPDREAGVGFTALNGSVTTPDAAIVFEAEPALPESIVSLLPVLQTIPEDSVMREPIQLLIDHFPQVLFPLKRKEAAKIVAGIRFPLDSQRATSLLHDYLESLHASRQVSFVPMREGSKILYGVDEKALVAVTALSKLKLPGSRVGSETVYGLKEKLKEGLGDSAYEALFVSSSAVGEVAPEDRSGLGITDEEKRRPVTTDEQAGKILERLILSEWDQGRLRAAIENNIPLPEQILRIAYKLAGREGGNNEQRCMRGLRRLHKGLGDLRVTTVQEFMEKVDAAIERNKTA